MHYLERIFPLQKDLEKHSILLLGPRRTGKSALIRHQVKADKVYNLLRADEFRRLSARPQLIRESLRPEDRLIVIDEIQKLPSLLDEVHLMIEEHDLRFLLTGSSARKLRRTYTSLMAGRAHPRRFCPFVSAELKDFDLSTRLLYGMLPPVVLAADPWEELTTYAGAYLREEIQAEALSRNIEGFSRFLDRAAASSGELVNFESVARDAQVPARTVREYFALLEDTLIASLIDPLQTEGKRKAVSRAKCFFFDIGVVHAMLGVRSLPAQGPELGRAFEHWIFQELFAYQQYFARSEKLQFWRTQDGSEVDFVIGARIAVEVKAAEAVHERDAKGLLRLHEEKRMQRLFLVSRDPFRRQWRGVDILPYTDFLAMLWSGDVFA